jgi:hypothetical protein
MQVGAWFASLPLDKKYLLAGVKSGWELWIGTNYFFYPGGNRYVNSPASGDPTAGIAGSVQLGYAAVCTMGLACSGPMTTPLLDAALGDFLAFTTGLLAPWLPRSKILTHAGNFPFASGKAPQNGVAYNSPAPALTPHGAPGWSFYYAAFNVSTGAGLSAALAPLNQTHWAASEFRYTGGNSGSEEVQWEASFTNTLGFANNRLIDVYNFENIDEAALAAVAAVVSSAPACLVDAAFGLASAPAALAMVQLSWEPGQASNATRVLVSTASSMLLSGLLASPDVASVDLPPGSTSYSLDTSAWAGVPLYWQVAEWGCSGSQQMVSEIAVVNGSA